MSEAAASEAGALNGDGGAPSPPTSTEHSPPTEVDWRAHIPAEFENDPSLADIKDLGGLIKTHVSAQRMLGGSIRIPSADASEADTNAFREKLLQVPGVVRIPDSTDEAGRAAFYDRLGRPKDPSAYEIERPTVPNGYEYDEATENWFREAAHKHGLSQEQAQAIYGEYQERQRNTIEEFETTVREARTALEKEWGPHYERRVGSVRHMLRTQGSDKLLDELDATGLGNNPELLMFLDRVARQTQEDDLMTGGSSGNLAPTATEVTARIAELEARPGHYDSKAPDHKVIVDELERLYQTQWKMQNPDG